jgi:hypothetical protein
VLVYQNAHVPASPLDKVDQCTGSGYQSMAITGSTGGMSMKYECPVLSKHESAGQDCSNAVNGDKSMVLNEKWNVAEAQVSDYDSISS